MAYRSWLSRGVRGASVLALAAACARAAAPGVPVLLTASPVRVIDHGDGERRAWARFGQCQLAFQMRVELRTELGTSANPEQLEQVLQACVERAIAEKVDVLVVPELALAAEEVTRSRILQLFRGTSDREEMIIVAGTYYDDDRRSRAVVIGPGWLEEGYKMRPSKFEASPLAGKGMREGRHVLAIKTPYGRLAVVVCVDLLSDEVQFTLRSMATKGELDAILNISWNPAAWEFLIEANSLARRHPVFVSITNATQLRPSDGCIRDNAPTDTGHCFGHTAVFADLKHSGDNRGLPQVVEQLPPEFVHAGKPALAVDHLVGDVGAFRQGILIYDLNLRKTRETVTTSAPDQGYPTIRNIKVVPF